MRMASDRKSKMTIGKIHFSGSKLCEKVGKLSSKIFVRRVAPQLLETPIYIYLIQTFSENTHEH